MFPMPEDRKSGFVTCSPSEETLPAYSTTWGNDVVEKQPRKRWNWWKLKYGWFYAHQFTTRNTIPMYDATAQTTERAINATSSFLRDQLWPFIKALTPSSTQVIAFFGVAIFGVAPLVFLGHWTPRNSSPPGHYPFYGIFQDKVLGCGNSFGTPENATVSGVEKFFVLDKTFGRFSFSEVKSLDVAWDILVGRGVQMIAWWVGYVVFTDALLRAIERHPTSFQIFQRIALEGPSLLSLWTLVKELWCSKSKRTKALFFYMWIATFYIICIPMFLGAMTGYDSTSIAWVSLDDDNNIVTADSIHSSGILLGTQEGLFDVPKCMDEKVYYDAWNEVLMRSNYCNCQLPNGTMLTPEASSQWFDGRWPRSWFTDCRFDYPGNNQTFTTNKYDYKASMVQKCGTSFNTTIDGTSYHALFINATSGYCYGDTGYDYTWIYDKTRCLPDTANPSYKWGFSTMLSGIFVFIHTTWSITMYIVWQDAQYKSTLVKAGYQMTPLRAAFAMAKAAKRKTGMSEKQLVRADTNELEQELYGTRSVKGTKIKYELFEEDDKEHGEVDVVVRRRPLRPKLDVGISDMSVSSANSSKLTTPVSPWTCTSP